MIKRIKAPKGVNITPLYKPGDVVYAISEANQESGESTHRVYKSIIDSISIDKSGVQYFLKNYEDGHDWAIYIPEVYVHKDINVLIGVLLKVWKI